MDEEGAEHHCAADEHEAEKERGRPGGAPETTVQLSPASMKRAIAPPKLQNSADRKTSRKPTRSMGCAAAKAARGAWVSLFAMRTASREWSLCGVALSMVSSRWNANRSRVASAYPKARYGETDSCDAL